MHVYRWDLDRTYLDTAIDSVRGLLRTALETAASKRNIPGSAALMRGLAASDPHSRVHILSGSPTQLRPVIEEKLALDGVHYHRLTLKDNLGNLRRGRLRAVRGQVGYKLPRLLQDRVGLGPSVTETLFGDDSETDALIYAVYAATLTGSVDEAELARVLEASHAYPDAIDRALRACQRIGQADAVEDAFIYVDKGRPLSLFATLGPKVVPVHSWFQAALLLTQRGRLSVPALVEVARVTADEARLDELALGSLVQDLVRRRRMTAPDALEILASARELEPVLRTSRRAISLLGAPPRPQRRTSADWVGFLRATRKDR